MHNNIAKSVDINNCHQRHQHLEFFEHNLRHEWNQCVGCTWLATRLTSEHFVHEQLDKVDVSLLLSIRTRHPISSCRLCSSCEPSPLATKESIEETSTVYEKWKFG